MAVGDEGSLNRTFGQSGNAALSIGRGNGKSAFVAALACRRGVSRCAIARHTKREVVCVASSFQQARVIFEDVSELYTAPWAMTWATVSYGVVKTLRTWRRWNTCGRGRGFAVLRK